MNVQLSVCVCVRTRACVNASQTVCVSTHYRQNVSHYITVFIMSIIFNVTHSVMSDDLISVNE